jgi:CHRD domain
MRRTIVLVVMLVLALLAALALMPGAVAGDNFVATLSGGQEVPARDTQARGAATFKLREDGAALAFKVNVANIDNVFAAHIHCGAVGVNGPVGVTLFMGSPAGGAVNGTLAEGTITAPDPGNGCGWADLTAVLAAMGSGATYVNVHTNDGVDPPNTGPGDFPGGEIRGQVR